MEKVRKLYYNEKGKPLPSKEGAKYIATGTYGKQGLETIHFTTVEVSESSDNAPQPQAQDDRRGLST
jgi:hypothetical protein